MTIFLACSHAGFFQREKLLPALWAKGQVVLDTGESFVERKAGEPAFSEFAEATLALAAIEFTVACLFNHANEPLNLFECESARDRVPADVR